MSGSDPFCFLSVHHFLDILAFIYLGLDSFGVFLDEVVFVPDHF